MPARKHIVLIAHGARASRYGFREMVSTTRTAGHLVEVHVTFERGDARELARIASAKGPDVVVAAGGDGTLNEVVNGLDGYDTPLGIIPLGTANDFATQIGIPRDARHAMDVILSSKPVRIDTASLNGRRFLNVSAAGVGAEVTAGTPARSKRRFGRLAYAIAGIRKFAEFESNHAVFRGGTSVLECAFLMLRLGSARAAGGGAMVAPP